MTVIQVTDDPVALCNNPQHVSTSVWVLLSPRIERFRGRCGERRSRKV